MTPNVKNFDIWMRSTFVEINTELENLYFRQENKANVAGVGESIKSTLLKEGRDLIIALIKEGNTDEGFDEGFKLLGNVGLYMAACRRHEIDESPDKNLMTEASSLALQLGAALGVTPRFATSHLTTHNMAYNGQYITFTSLEDEQTFIDYNTRGILSYKRAADALLRIIENKGGCASRQIFNLGNPKNNVSVRELAKLIIAAFQEYPEFAERARRAKVLTVTSEKYFGRYYQDIDRRVPVIKQARQQLGWTPKVTLPDAIRLTLDYHLAHQNYRLE